MGWLRWLDRNKRIAFVPAQTPGAAQAAGLTAEQSLEAAWAIMPDGQTHRGAAAINAALGIALGLPILIPLYYLPGIRCVEDAAYDWIARNRYKLPGGTPACRIDR